MSVRNRDHLTNPIFHPMLAQKSEVFYFLMIFHVQWIIILERKIYLLEKIYLSRFLLAKDTTFLINSLVWTIPIVKHDLTTSWFLHGHLLRSPILKLVFEDLSSDQLMCDLEAFATSWSIIPEHLLWYLSMFQWSFCRSSIYQWDDFESKYFASISKLWRYIKQIEKVNCWPLESCKDLGCGIRGKESLM